MKYRSWTLLILIGMAFSSAAWAGCGQTETQCLVIAEGEESSESCEVTVCSNMHSHIVAWELENGGTVSHRMEGESYSLTVNDQAGIAIPSSILKDGLTCYAAVESSIVYCTKE